MINYIIIKTKTIMKKVLYILFVFATLNLLSCASSKSSTTIAEGASISNYKYMVFGQNDEDSSPELADIMLMVHNELSSRLKVVSQMEAIRLMNTGEYVISPRIMVKTEKWDGGHTYITISLYDADTNQLVAVVKSSGIGLSISQDQALAFKALKKELDKVFK